MFGFVTEATSSLLSAAVSPVADVVDVLDGLSEGEIREKAILRLGADAVGGMALAEVIEAMR